MATMQPYAGSKKNNDGFGLVGNRKQAKLQRFM
jgi:hypothetical protein